MRETLIAFALAVLAAASSFGQGAVVFSNSGGARIDRTSTGAPVPVGSVLQAGLFWAPEHTSDAEFDTVARQVGPPANFGPTPGFFSGGGRTIEGISRGGIAKFQVRIWETAYGNSYDEVYAAYCSGNLDAEFGKTPPFLVDTADYLGGEAPASIGTLIPTFIVSPVGQPWPCIPEPSLIVPGLLSIVAFLMLRHRRD